MNSLQRLRADIFLALVKRDTWALNTSMLADQAIELADKLMESERKQTNAEMIESLTRKQRGSQA